MLSDFRPISLSNVVYKILAKVLANRLTPILNNIIVENQSAFIPERMITNNIMLAFETHHFMRRKSQGKDGYAALKIDMIKAYDRVEWNMLRAILLKFGLCERWVNLVMTCVETVSYHVLVEDKEIGPIHRQRGLKQADPLSPYLFIMVVEGLNALIRHYECRGQFHGIAVARYAPRISHFLFADNNFIFFKANPSESEVCKNILATYATASGQIINFEKSSITFSKNVREKVRGVVSDILGVRSVGNSRN